MIKKEDRYKWFRKTKPRRILAACLSTLVLFFMHTWAAVDNALRVIYRNYSNFFYNMKVIWGDYVPNGYGELHEDHDAL